MIPTGKRVSKSKKRGRGIYIEFSKICVSAAFLLSIAFIVAGHFAPGAWQTTYQTVLTVLFYLAALASLLSFTTYMSAIVKSRALSDMTR